MAQPTISYSISSRETESYWIKKFWSNIVYYSKNSPESSENLTSTIKNEIEVFTSNLAVLGSIRSNNLRANAQKYFSKNPLAITKTYNEILENEKSNPDYLQQFNPITYSYNKDSFRTQFLAEVISQMRALNSQIQSNPECELKVIKEAIPTLDKSFEKLLKQQYAKILMNIGDFMKKFNLLEEFSSTYRSVLSGYGLHDLGYPTHSDLPNCKSIDTFFTENFLNTLNLQKLTALSSFWLNKAAKSIISLNNMLFIINEFDLWADVESGKKQCPLTADKITLILKKTSFVAQLEGSIFDYLETMQLENPTMSSDEINDLCNNAINEEIKNKKDRYKSRFDKLLPELENNMDKDITQLHRIYNARYLLYRLKDICIFNLLIGSIDNHFSQNWGVIVENMANDEFININFDIEGLNMPLRLHMYKSELQNFLEEYAKDCIVPLYKGGNDLSINGMYISSSILLPMYVKQTSCINDKLKNEANLPPEVVKFLKHLKFLKNASKVPPTFISTAPNEPNALNLETGQELCVPKKEMFK